MELKDVKTEFKRQVVNAFNSWVYPFIRYSEKGTLLTDKVNRDLLSDPRPEMELKTLDTVDQSDCRGIDSFDWKNLIIMDACRHDYYGEVTGREVDSRLAIGGCSPHFVEKNFSDGDWSDVFYISANPFTSEDNLKNLTGKEDVFHTVWELYRTDWDDELGIVPPDSVVEKVKTVQELYPEKRKIIHFMQPHHPFLTEDGEKRRRGPNFSYVTANNGLVRSKKLVKGYKENISIVENRVQELKEILTGRTIATADHGELLGEDGIYGHYEKFHEAELLRKVPHEVIID